jgi:hypothetical protein
MTMSYVYSAGEGKRAAMQKFEKFRAEEAAAAARARTDGKSIRPKSVTHVLGTFCHPCLRAGP